MHPLTHLYARRLVRVRVLSLTCCGCWGNTWPYRLASSVTDTRGARTPRTISSVSKANTEIGIIRDQQLILYLPSSQQQEDKH
ncbi:hypothetical protein F5B18DRAFT_624747 [Nemania serpens]|nr:hypothetical protein F5B18DRAFT_624747 [Nemania serpens]